MHRLSAALAGEAREIQRILHEISRLFADARDDLSAAVEIVAELANSSDKNVVFKLSLGMPQMPSSPEMMVTIWFFLQPRYTQ